MDQFRKYFQIERAKKKSRSVAIKEMPVDQISDDVGLLSQTFIRPPNREMPGLFSRKWKWRLKFEWLWIKTRALNFMSLVYSIWWCQRKMPKSKRMPLDLSARPAIALDLHNRLYTSLAAGDLPSLRHLLCSGIAAKAKSQINYRAHLDAPPQSWKIVRYTSIIRPPFFLRLFPWPLTSLLPGSHAKIVSDRATPFPFGDDLYIRQCVVRIRSLQSLDRGDGNPPSQENLTEYLVMQQLPIDGRAPSWKIWGTTQPTTAEEMEKLVEDARGAGGRYTLLDRFG